MAAATGALGSGPMPSATWQQSMIRVKDPAPSLAFYRDVMGMTLVDKYDFPSMKFSLYFLQTLPAGASAPHEPGSDAAHAALWATPGVTLELTHNWGTEAQPDFKHHPGNGPGDGFGHLAFAVTNLDEACARLDAAGVPFKKRPSEGRMRTIAFVYDPDGYWVEIVERDDVAGAQAPYFAFAQTMLRCRDPKPSLEFYTQALGMTLVRETHADTFSIYFLATLPTGTQVPDPTSTEAREFVKRELYPARVPILELTHNHGTEKDASFKHATGNEEGRRGFGHLGFLVPDVYATTAALQARGADFSKLPDAGSMKGLAFAKDPDGYLIELIKRGQDGKFPGLAA